MGSATAMAFAAEVTGSRLIESWDAAVQTWTADVHHVDALRNAHVAMEGFRHATRSTAPLEKAVERGECAWLRGEELSSAWDVPEALQLGAALLVPCAPRCWVLWFRAAPPSSETRTALAAWCLTFVHQCAKGVVGKAMWAAEGAAEEEEKEKVKEKDVRASLSLLLPSSPTATTWSLYVRKWRGQRVHTPAAAVKGEGEAAPRVWLRRNNLLYGARVVPWVELWWTFLGSFVSIAVLALIHYEALLAEDMVMVIGSFGATAVLLYAAQESPLASPRNCLGGHFLSALWGVTCWKLHEAFLPEWCAAALSVAGAITIMQGTATTHPPGGATALIAVIGGELVHDMGYLYVLVPVVGGAAWMLLWAMLVNNVPPSRRYPVLWW